jgi:glycosyltransferase involved in cell wall biosynthesis
MGNCNPTSPPPHLSVVIAAYNDWAPLDQCLPSLAGQVNPPMFEVIIVDDGSQDHAPDSVHNWSETYPLMVVREQHAGVDAARNRGDLR